MISKCCVLQFATDIMANNMDALMREFRISELRVKVAEQIITSSGMFILKLLVVVKLLL